MERILFSSESVTEGHPDKVCDQISDAVLDACLKQDPNSRVACETLAKGNALVIAGEITTKADILIPDIARNVLREIGYTDKRFGIDAETCNIQGMVDTQSPDISQGVTAGKGLFKEQGAGDQGMMFGYAVNETDELMPLSIMVAHELTERLAEARKERELPYLRPDGKSQVTVEYIDGIPKRIEAVVLSTQHDEDVKHGNLERDCITHIIMPTCADLIDEDTKIYVNPTGKFVQGGPEADAGLTGRKIIVDTYGGHGAHGGGAFSGKDPSKVDRSAAYAARLIAKNIVAAGMADRCLVQLAYAIGVAEPVSVNVECFGTNSIPEESICRLAREHFPTKPADIIEKLDLRRPIFQKTASYGHFGRDDPDFTWELTDIANSLRYAAGR